MALQVQVAGLTLQGKRGHTSVLALASTAPIRSTAWQVMHT